MTRSATVLAPAALLSVLLVTGCGQPPPPLTGMTVDIQASTAPSGTGCDGENGTFPFAVTGPVTGPYPGTIDESGTVAVSGGHVTQLDGTFTITSSTTTVHGRFSLATGDQGGFCVPTMGEAAAHLTYAATVSGGRKGTLKGTLELSVVSGPLAGAALTETFS